MGFNYWREDYWLDLQPIHTIRYTHINDNEYRWIYSNQQICSVCRNHNRIFSSYTTYQRYFAISKVGTGRPSGKHEFSSSFCGVHGTQSLVFCVIYWRSLFVFLFFFFWPLYTLSFVYLRLLISSNLSDIFHETHELVKYIDVFCRKHMIYGRYFILDVYCYFLLLLWIILKWRSSVFEFIVLCFAWKCEKY